LDFAVDTHQYQVNGVKMLLALITSVWTLIFLETIQKQVGMNFVGNGRSVTLRLMVEILQGGVKSGLEV